jgi:hypothetical protein
MTQVWDNRWIVAQNAEKKYSPILYPSWETTAKKLNEIISSLVPE